MAMKKARIIIRMGTEHWDARVRDGEGNWHRWDFRKMEKKQRSNFHRDLMNAFRSKRI